jgi:hypothetical protein
MKLGNALSGGILAVVGLGLAGCGGGSKPTTPQCALNSDCAKLSTPGLVCALGYCVTPCKFSSDCPSGERCIIVTVSSTDGDAGAGNTADGGVQGNACQAPETVSCQYTSQCRTPLVCGNDRQCRDQCETNVDCPMLQVCTSVTHLCADPSIDKDYSSAINDFIVDGGAGGSGGSSGGSSGGAGKGGAGGGSGGVGGNHDAGAGGAAPINGDPCVANPDGGFAAEPTPNDDPTHATPVPLGTPYRGCLETVADLDYFQFTIPTPSVQGGWLTVLVNGVATALRAQVTLSAASDNGMIVVGVGPNVGANASVYVAGKPGVQFLAAVTPYNAFSGTGAYTITASFQDNPETGEPNNIRSQATPLTLSTPFQAKFFAAYGTSVAPAAADWTDWFSIALTPGNFTVKLTNAPADINSQMFLYDPQGNQLSNAYTYTLGGDLILSPTITTAGTYFVSALPQNLPAATGTGVALPMWATGTYALTVAPAP